MALPKFPDYSTPVTEDRLERSVQHLTNWADKLLMNNKVSQEEYDNWYKAMRAWADNVRILYAKVAGDDDEGKI
jgi:hypothetical protein